MGFNREVLRRIVGEVDEFLKTKDSVREYLIKSSRDVIRESGYVITDIHAGNINKAKERIIMLRSMVKELIAKVKDHPELMYGGTMYNALAEYVEAEVFFSIITSLRIPNFKELEVHPIPYIQGLLDVVGELKRYVVDLIRSNDMERAWRMFSVAEAIYEACKSLDYPEALVPGLRRKVDIARNVVEALRVLLIDIDLRIRLDKSMRILSDKLKSLVKESPSK